MRGGSVEQNHTGPSLSLSAVVVMMACLELLARQAGIIHPHCHPLLQPPSRSIVSPEICNQTQSETSLCPAYSCCLQLHLSPTLSLAGPLCLPKDKEATAQKPGEDAWDRGCHCDDVAPTVGTYGLHRHRSCHRRQASEHVWGWGGRRWVRSGSLPPCL